MNKIRTDNIYSIRELNDNISKVIDKTINEGKIIITKHGKPQVVMLSIEEYNKLVHKEGD